MKESREVRGTLTYKESGKQQQAALSPIGATPLPKGPLHAVCISSSSNKPEAVVFVPHASSAYHNGARTPSLSLVYALAPNRKASEIIVAAARVRERLSEDGGFLFGSEALSVLKEKLPALLAHSSKGVRQQAAALQRLVDKCDRGESFAA